jgi:Ca2+/Na+ antiporter
MSPAALRGLAFGVFFMAAFAFAWMTGAAYFLRRMRWQTLLLVCAVTAALCFGAERQLQRAGHRNQWSPELQSETLGRKFKAVVVAENAVVFFAIFVVIRIGRSDLVVPVIATIVGVHFIPLALILGILCFGGNHRRKLTGLEDSAPNVRHGVTCAACGLALWITSAMVLLKG